MINRIEPETAPETAFTNFELHLLDTVIGDKRSAGNQKKSLSTYLLKLARRGGYLVRTHDPLPGNKVIWRGLTRLTDIELGALIGARHVGN